MTSNKNKQGGKGYRKGKKSVGERKLIFAEKEQFYAKATKHLGDQRLLCVIHDEFTTDKKKIIEHMAHIRGKMRKKVWVNVGDIIIVTGREFGDKTYDVIHKYEYEEVKQLYKLGKLTNIEFISDRKYNETEQSVNDSNGFDFESDEEDKIANQNVKYDEETISESEEEDNVDVDYI